MKKASTGNNVTLLLGISVGVNTMIGVGLVVNKYVPNYAVVIGNSAKIIRYIK